VSCSISNSMGNDLTRPELRLGDFFMVLYCIIQILHQFILIYEDLYKLPIAAICFVCVSSILNLSCRFLRVHKPIWAPWAQAKAQAAGRAKRISPEPAHGDLSGRAPEQ
jgi:hypothetical protein